MGGLAGIALIAVALMFFLKWRKRQINGMQLLGDGDGPGRRLSLFSRGGPGGGGDGGAGGGMAERSLPFAFPSSIAALGGNRRASQAKLEGAEPEPGERSFYRVSGRKLNSVLHSGGDGYGEPHEPHEPHDRAVSGTSFYRDSMAMFNHPDSQPLQLGSPMRPESGIVVVRSGPARTPVQAQGPFFDDNPGRLSPPTLGTLGRSLMSQAGSRASAGSGSRFTEDV